MPRIAPHFFITQRPYPATIKPIPVRRAKIAKGVKLGKLNLIMFTVITAPRINNTKHVQNVSGFLNFIFLHYKLYDFTAKIG